MSWIMALTKRILLCGVVLTMTVLAINAQNVKSSKALVRAVRGEAQYKTNPAADWTPLKVGTLLNPGALVETGKGAGINLFLDQIGSGVRVMESTQLEINKLNFAAGRRTTVVEAILNLKAGAIAGDVKKLAAGSRYEVNAPNIVCSLRGTEFKVTASGMVYVLSGLATVTYSPPAAGEKIEVDVPAGHFFTSPSTLGSKPTVLPIPTDHPIWAEGVPSAVGQ
jgi:hypothetical protein